MSRIIKTVLQVIVLHPAEHSISGVPLEDIAYQINEGDWLGQTSVQSQGAVPLEKLDEECRALGNDGGFFDPPDEEVP